MLDLANRAKNKLFYRVARITVPTAIALACLFYITTSFNWTEIGLILRGTNLATFFIGTVISTIAFWLLRAFRWKALLDNESFRTSFSGFICTRQLRLDLPILRHFNQTKP
jgi:hypothetical protein